MFSFLKDKLKQAIGKFKKGVEQEAKPEVSHEPAVEATVVRPQKPEPEKPVVQEPKIHVEKLPKKKVEKPIIEEDASLPVRIEVAQKKIDSSEPAQALETKKPEPAIIERKIIEPEISKPVETSISEEPQVAKPVEASVKAKPQITEQVPEKKGFFERLKESVTKRTLTEEKFEELFFDLEIAMLENNVAFEVVEKIKGDLKEELVNSKVGLGKVEETIEKTLKRSLDELFEVDAIDVIALTKKKPLIVIFLGVNGAGKTTTVAKFAHMLKKRKLRVVMAAADTFRAAAIQQLEEHARKLDIRLIKHDYGSDPAAVAFDAVRYGESKGTDVVLIDTAGRQHSNSNLMEEMKKVIRVAKPDLKIFVGESITGNDCVEQAKSFDEAVGIDGIILSKADVDEKGGAAISISYVTRKPIMYLGTGQDYDSLTEFNKGLVLEKLGFTRK